MESTSIYQQLQVIKVIQETPHAKTFVLKQISGDTIHYKAGQFINLVFTRNGLENRRSYSFSSSPMLDDNVCITVKYVENGEYSRKMLLQIKPGDIIYAAGCSGFFTLPEKNIKEYEELFFFAAGSGITPIYSIIKSALQLHPHLKIRLVYSNSNKRETIFYDSLSALQQQYDNRFSILFLFSAEKDLMNARLNSFMVSGMVKDFAATELNKVLFYVCGPLDYMDNITITLLTEGVSRANIRKENFAAYIPELKEEPPDKEEHRVQINTGKRVETIHVKYPVTILQQAKKEGLHLPYSCEAGQCGSCTARCVKGKVWMYYNEVLTDKELEEGLVLTCTGFPVGGDVELRYE